MTKFVAGTAVIVGIAIGTVTATSPGLKAQLRSYWRDVTGWNDKARQVDPVGFANHAEKKLKSDLTSLIDSRRELIPELANVTEMIREQRALRNHAEQLAVEFRDQFQVATQAEAYPVSIRGRNYTQEEVKSQVSMLLAEGEGYGRVIERLVQVQELAQTQLEGITVRINETEAQIAEVQAKRPVLRAQELSEEGKQLLAQVDDLLHGNAEMLHSNPVRSVQELLAAPTESGESTVRMERVNAFLTTETSPDQHRPASTGTSSPRVVVDPGDQAPPKPRRGGKRSKTS